MDISHLFKHGAIIEELDSKVQTTVPGNLRRHGSNRVV